MRKSNPGIRKRLVTAGAFLLLVFLLAAVAQVEDPLRQHYDAAEKFLQSGDQQRAAAEYKAFLAEALHRIGNGRADAGQFDAAVRLFGDAVAFAPDDLALKFDYAKVSFDADKLVQARTLAEEVATSPGATRAARFLLGRVLFHLGEFDPAKQQLEKVFAEKPEFNVGYLLAKTYLLLHQDQKAQDLLRTMASDFGDTGENEVYFGRVYSETDHPEEAIAVFQGALAKDAHAPDAHYYMGLTYLGHNESAGYLKAIPEFRAELQLSPNDFRSHYMLGYIALNQRNFPEAESELLSAVALAPNDIQSLLQLAEVYNDTNRLPQAETELRKVITIAGDKSANEGQASRAHYLLGRILEKTGHQAEAANEMKIVAAIQKRMGPSSMQSADTRTTKEAQDQPKQSAVSPEKLAQLDHFVDGLRPPIAVAYNNLGAISASSRDFAAAAKYFQSAAEWNASLPGLDEHLGMALFYSEQYADAMQPLQRYLQVNPTDAQARSMLALSFYKDGDFHRVIETLQPMASQIAGDPTLASADADSYFQLGKFQLDAGQTDAAIGNFEAATKLFPQNAAFHNQLAIAYRRAGRAADAEREEKYSQTLTGGQSR